MSDLERRRRREAPYEAYFKRLEDHYDLKLDQPSKDALLLGFNTTWLGTLERRSLSKGAASALRNIGKKATNLLDALDKTHENYPGLLEDVPHMYADPDFCPPPMIHDQNVIALNDELKGLIAAINVLRRASKFKEIAIRRRLEWKGSRFNWPADHLAPFIHEAVAV